MAVIGDDLAHGHPRSGHWAARRTVLVRSGISRAVDFGKLPARRRPDAAVDGVAELLDWL